MTCIFCEIIQGKFNTEFIYEDDHVVVFRDIHPKSPTHLLIVPKEHIETMIDLNETNVDIMKYLVLAANKVAKILKLGGFKVQINVGKEGGQEIFHLHMHLLSQSV